VLKYLLRLLRSKHYSTSSKDGSGDALKKTGPSAPMMGAPSLGSSEPGVEIPLPVVIANVLLYILKVSLAWMTKFTRLY
jgi:hypothetical protein